MIKKAKLTSVDAISICLLFNAIHKGVLPFSSLLFISAPRLHNESTTGSNCNLIAIIRGEIFSFVLAEKIALHHNCSF